MQNKIIMLNKDNKKKYKEININIKYDKIKNNEKGI